MRSVRSHQLRSDGLGMLRAGSSDTTRLIKSCSPFLKLASIAEAGLYFSVPSLYTRRPYSGLPCQGESATSGSAYM